MNQNSSPNSDAVFNLIEELHKLPGVGRKSAQRIAYYIMRTGDEEANLLVKAIQDVKQKTKLCNICFNVTEAETCHICSNIERDPAKLCVVEQPQDILAIEHTRKFNGFYHVLHGALSPSDKIGADDLKIKELLARLNEGSVKEVILATNTNFEGEQTALYLHRLISPLGIRVTRLARGLPYGSELEYADDVTLARALEGRQEF